MRTSSFNCLNKIILIAIFCLGSGIANAQDETPTITLITNTIEEYLESTDADNFDFNTVFEHLNHYLEKPLNINLASEAELKELFILNEIQIANFITYRREFGDFIAIQELQAVPTWDLELLKDVTPFLTCSSAKTTFNLNIRDAFKNGSSTLFVKAKRVLEQRDGFIENVDGSTPYQGDPNHLYVRYRFEYGQQFKAGFTAEKDPGERLFGNGSKYGMDFYSFFVQARQLNKYIHTLSLGDYAVSMGQGLILHNAFGAGKTSYVMNVKRSGLPIKPYSSVNEVNFFRGAAAVVNLRPNWQMTVFGSYKPIDATIDQDTLENNDFDSFGSIRLDGYHRTLTEIGNKNTVNQTNLGGQLVYKIRDLKIGGNVLFTHFNKPLLRDDALYRKFLFDGQRLTNASVDYNWRVQNFTFFGEVAASDNGGIAQLHGLLTSLDRRVDMSIVYRNYEPQYQVLNANAFAESSLPINEKGVYLGMEIRPYKGFTLSSYIDMWQNPWVGYRKDSPTNGKEFLVKLAYTIKRKLDVYAQYRYERKQINNSELSKIDFPSDIDLQRLRLHLSYKINKEWEIRDRVELSFFNGVEGRNGKGNLIYQDLIYKPIAKAFSFTARYAIFDVNSFDARIYAYENDLLYEFYIPFYQNIGTRYYVNTRWRVLNNLTWEFRIGRVHFQNVDGISSGNNFIDKPHMTEIKTQFKYKF
jgi:Helix-hairpin-helix motif